MSNLQPAQGRSSLRVPTPPRGDLIARYPTYLEAQRAVEHLSDRQFPVQYVTIVGSGLRMVERVTGRLSYPRVAVAGAWLGASFGSLVGLMFLLFGSSSGSASGEFGTAVVLGTVFGILQGVLSYALTRGRRDFTSSSQIVASEYEVLCLSEHAATARNLLHELSWGATGSASPAALPPPPSGTPGQGWGSPSGQPSVAASAAAEAPPMDVSGPTYSEMIEKQKRAKMTVKSDLAQEAAQAEQAERNERAEHAAPGEPGTSSEQREPGEQVPGPVNPTGS